MAELTVTIDGYQMSGREGMTILELAQEKGIDIPTLCYIPELPPTGACRVCVVEVEGSRTLVGSCHTPIAQGMVIYTNSPKVLETRKVIVELLLASHCGSCFMCEKANMWELRKIAADLIKELKDICQGVHVMAIGWEKKVPQILDAAGL
jgi:NADH-quinone oxidoreductase subunit G/NADP-reducing hydrogenase subunit HndD